MTSQDHIQGSNQAPLTLVEYGDYECPYCGMAYPVVKKLQKHFGKNLRFVFRNFPLTEIHPHAQLAAETAEFAAAHNRFWEIHDLIYENQESLSGPFLLELALSQGLSSKELEEALKMGTYPDQNPHRLLGGVRSGVNGTPTFFINEQRYNGPAEYDEMVVALSSLASH